MAGWGLFVLASITESLAGEEDPNNTILSQANINYQPKMQAENNNKIIFRLQLLIHCFHLALLQFV